MGKKNAFTKGGNKIDLKKNPFKVAGNQHNKKPKAVKTQIKKVNEFLESSMPSTDYALFIL